MVKRNKVVCIEEHIHEKLNGLNASQLVNGLLEKHFAEQSNEAESRAMSIPELEARIAKNKKRDALQEQMEALDGE